MSRYELLLFLHVVGAIVWSGLLLTGLTLFYWADRNDERAVAYKLDEAIAWLEPGAAVAGPLLLLITGIALVFDGPWHFTDLWVALALGGFAAALALGAAFEGPQGKRLRELSREHGPDASEVVALGRRVQAVGYLELAILAFVVLTMTTKPVGQGSTEYWSLAAGIVGIGCAAAARTYASTRATPQAVSR
jgi:hypothetical protein